jgi:hypothetical protein
MDGNRRAYTVSTVFETLKDSASLGDIMVLAEERNKEPRSRSENTDDKKNDGVNCASGK